MGRAVPAKDIEERKKRREEEEALKNVQNEFVEHFDDKPTTKINKTWVKAGTFDAGSRKEDSAGKGTLYKPTSKLISNDPAMASTARAVEEARRKAEALAVKPAKPGKKNKMEKKKTNLEIFKEELKAIQEERDKRAGLKPGGPSMAPGGNSMLSLENVPGSGYANPIYTVCIFLLRFSDMLADVGGDPTTTNLYLGNLSPRLTEPVLTEMFGRLVTKVFNVILISPPRFGPLASVKIMYPRTEDEKLRGKHCGFVAFMAR